MTVYVDDMYKLTMGRFGRMKMSHMIADTDDELHAFAERLGLKRQWFQGNHYDVSLSVRRQAVELGAVEITIRQCGAMLGNRHAGWPMGTPETCLAIAQQRRSQKEPGLL